MFAMRSVLFFLALSLYVLSLTSWSVCGQKIDHYQIRPMKLGIEITDMNLQENANNSALFERIKEDVYRHRLVLFRNQGRIPDEIFSAMFSVFGQAYKWKPQIQNHTIHKKEQYEEILRISNDAVQGYRELGTSGWHIDGTYTRAPFAFVIFNAVKASRNGDTKFVGHREVIASMGRTSLQKLEQLWLVIKRSVLGEIVHQVLPVIHTHPVVNESVFCFHLGYTKGAIYNYTGQNQTLLNQEQVVQIKREIAREFSKDSERLVYQHKWMDGDLIIVDNWQVSHMASKGTQISKDKVGLRLLHRLAIMSSQKPRKQFHVAG